MYALSSKEKEDDSENEMSFDMSLNKSINMLRTAITQ